MVLRRRESRVSLKQQQGAALHYPNQVKASHYCSDESYLSWYQYLMLVTSSALHLDSHLYSPSADDNVTTCLILSYELVLLLRCSEFRLAPSVNKNSSEGGCPGEEKQQILGVALITDWARGHDCHILYLNSVCACVSYCVNRTLNGWESRTHPSPLPPVSL